MLLHLLLSYSVMSHPITSFLIVFCHVLSYRMLSYRILTYSIISHPIDFLMHHCRWRFCNSAVTEHNQELQSIHNHSPLSFIVVMLQRQFWVNIVRRCEREAVQDKNFTQYFINEHLVTFWISWTYWEAEMLCVKSASRKLNTLVIQ